MQYKRPSAKRSAWERGSWYLLLSLPVGLGVLLGTLLFLSVLLLISDTPDWMISLVSAIALGLSGYAMAYYAGFHRRKKGLQTGFFCGFLLYLFLLGVGFFWQGIGLGLLRFAILIVGGMWGGISGVNAMHKRPPC